MASIRKTTLSPYWQAVLTFPDGTRTNRSTKQTDKGKAKEIADAMEQTIISTRQRLMSREKLLRTFNDLMIRVEGCSTHLANPSRRSKPPKMRLTAEGWGRSEIDMLAELHRRLGRDKSSPGLKF
jgi:hypothetical protein